MKIINLPYTYDLSLHFSNIANYNWSIWLDSNNNHKDINHNINDKHNQRYDIISAFPYKIITANVNNTIIKDLYFDNKLQLINHNFKLIPNNFDNNPFTIINNIIKNINKKSNINKDSSSPPFWHGALGYFGYDLNQILHPKLKKLNFNNIPIAALGIYSWALISDHRLNKTYIAYDHNFIEESKIIYILELLTSNNIGKKNIIIKDNNINLTTKIDLSEYSYNFNKIKRYIKSGDCYQVNYCLPFKYNFKKNNNEKHSRFINLWGLYKNLRYLNPNPFGCYFKINNHTAILSYSPERFIKVNNNIISTEPIKGTRPNLTNNPDLNNYYISDLLNNPKERAENIMITDLMRNDLNKHCIAGSVTTYKICELHSFPTVHHLISKINGKLNYNITSIDALMGCFPGGSITGAPKLRSMQIIQELENYNNHISRYIYCGSIGYINCNYNLDMNIAIRTSLVKNNTLYYWAGSGIVADSDCEEEYNEILSKLIKTKVNEETHTH